MSFAGFPKDTLRFLADLSKNNDRDWFADNKDRYESAFVEPSLEFIAAMEKPLKKISPFLVAAPKKQSGSLMRIYRDVRFSKNKNPYKTNIGIQFRHEAGKDVHAPGLYVHLAPWRSVSRRWDVASRSRAAAGHSSGNRRERIRLEKSDTIKGVYCRLAARWRLVEAGTCRLRSRPPDDR